MKLRFSHLFGQHAVKTRPLCPYARLQSTIAETEAAIPKTTTAGAMLVNELVGPLRKKTIGCR
jgi:hypothetical protein